MIRVLAIELYNAAQAIEFRRPLKTSAFLEELIAKYRKVVNFVENDVQMYSDLEKSIRFIEDNDFEI